jgi:flagellar protein FliS
MNPYTTYKRQSVNTLTPIEVIVKIYDECERQLHRAVNFIENKEYAAAHTSIDVACELILGLRSVLNSDAGEIAGNLDSLYEFFYRQLVQADMKKDVSIIHEILPQICELKDAFTQISKIPREGAAARGGNILGMGMNG